MEYVYDYLSFLAQAVTIVVAILIVMAAAANVSSRRQTVRKGHLEVEKVNERLEDEPETVNADPYNDGWFYKLKPSDTSELDALLSMESFFLWKPPKLLAFRFWYRASN